MGQNLEFIQQWNATSGTNATAAISQATSGAFSLILGGWLKYTGTTGNALENGTSACYSGSASGGGLGGNSYAYRSNASIPSNNVVVTTNFYPASVNVPSYPLVNIRASTSN